MPTSNGASAAARALFARALVALGFAVLAPPASAGLPWEVWQDLRELAVLRPAVQPMLRSSHCPSGCSTDRHSPGDSRFLRLEGDDGVLLDEAGPGALVRIWMTTGGTTSQPLDPALRVRFYFDGEIVPRLDLPLPDLFRGNAPPFTPPLVADRLRSSGGFVSYVPITFAERLKVTLTDSPALRLWFQFNVQRLSPGEAVQSFTGAEDLTGLRSLLSAGGADPWPALPGVGFIAGTKKLTVGVDEELYAATGGGTITGLLLAVSPAHWETTWLVLTIDGETTVEVPLDQFFGVRAGAALDPRSLFAGRNAQGELYCYFPVPFSSSFRAALRNAGPGSISVGYAVRRDPRPPLAGSGRFAAEARVAEPWSPGSDLPLADVKRGGKWVGLAAELASVGTTQRKYLEGDERVFLDGARSPSLYGTGVEDLGNGGFYFDQGPFVHALAGMVHQETVSPSRDETRFYRLFLTDTVSFRNRLFAGLEPGPAGDLTLAVRSVAYLYLDEGTRLARTDSLAVGDAASRAEHAYQTPSGAGLTVSGEFEGEPPLAATVSGVVRPAGSNATFVLDAARCGRDLRLRRLFDAEQGGQDLAVWSRGVELARLGFAEPNAVRRLREIDLDLALAPGVLPLRLHLTVESTAAPGEVAFTELGYELWCVLEERRVFADGFEAGDTSAWTLAEP